METKKTHCRVCHALCAMEVDIEEGRPVRVRGDRSDPVHGGYSCIKGQQMIEQHEHPERLRTSLKRNEAASFEPIASEQAIDEIAAQIEAIIRQYGPNSVALYTGTNGTLVSGGNQVYQAWLAAIGSSSFYTSMSIDQPAKFYVAPSRHGVWSAGLQDFQSADVSLLLGANPPVSLYSGPRGGVTPYNPIEQIRRAKQRGMKLIAIDPRKTRFAREADLHLQVKPGEDATLLCGMLRQILADQRYDHEFCDQYVEGLAELQQAVEPYTPAYVETRTLVPANLIVDAARLFAQGPKGAASSGTGADMGPRGNLVAHLILALNTICGRYRRAGDLLSDTEVLFPSGRRVAEVIPPWADQEPPVRSRIRNLPGLWDPRMGPVAELPTSTLADEILTPGEGQVRALFCIGGNPIAAWPNQGKVRRALESLELFVSVDIKLSASAKLADYVIAPKLGLERDDVAYMMDLWSPLPYAHYARALIDADFDVIEEWQLFVGLARRLGTPMQLHGGTIPLDRPVTKHDILKLAFAQPAVPLDQLRECEGGKVYPELVSTIEAPTQLSSGKLQLAPVGITKEITKIYSETFTSGGGYGERSAAFSHRLICRREKHAYNSSVRDLTRSRKKGTTNPAYMNSEDMTSLGIKTGDLVKIESRTGQLFAIAEASDDISAGVVSMSHAWGDLPEYDDKVREIGSCIARLIDDEHEIDPFAGMPLQSALPVTISCMVAQDSSH